jgi:hypothetical protein
MSFLLALFKYCWRAIVFNFHTLSVCIRFKDRGIENHHHNKCWGQNNCEGFDCIFHAAILYGLSVFDISPGQCLKRPYVRAFRSCGPRDPEEQARKCIRSPRFDRPP